VSGELGIDQLTQSLRDGRLVRDAIHSLAGVCSEVV
jgi:hypothetical protein